MPEGYVEEAGAAADDEEAEEAEVAERNELTYICGRVWLNDIPKTQEAKAQKMKSERSYKSINEDGEEQTEKPVVSAEKLKEAK